MAMLAGIGDLPDTIEDRAIIIVLRRKTGAEPVRKYRIRRDKPLVRKTGERLAEWAATIAERAGRAEPVMPPGLDDRAEDIWEALLAVADLAGGDWPGRARRAAQVLSSGRDEQTTIGERLLADLRAVFGDRDAMHGASILTALHEIAEGPWADWHGRPLTARDLAGLLRHWRVSSTDVKIGGTNRKGYRREQFHELWSRYVPPEAGGSATGATSATAQVSEVSEVAGSGQLPLPATGDPPVTRAVAQVAEVADPPGAGSRGWPEGTLGAEANERSADTSDDEFPF
jgi:hypothetical protein